MDQFLTVENFKMCKAVLQIYMQDKYGFDVSRVPIDALNPLIYQVMREVQNNYRDSIRDIKDANNIALNIVKERLLGKYGQGTASKAAPSPATKPLQVQPLERDASLFGNRPMPDSLHLRSEPVTHKADDGQTMMQTYESIMQQRKPVADPPGGASAPSGTNQRVDPMPSTEFAKKITELERSRDDVFKAAQDTARPLIPDDPAALYRMNNASAADAASGSGSTGSGAAVFPGKSAQATQKELQAQLPLRDYVQFNQESLIPYQSNVHPKLEIKHYITINAGNRDWTLDPFRYRFNTAYLNNMVNYRNITSIEFTRLIIPLEIKETPSVTHVPKPHYQHRLDFAYPYLLLSIPELDNVYAGYVKAQTAFVYDNNYCSYNGRGFLVLSPMQGEKLEFRTNPLASLPRMTVSILKPSGQLFNQSKDLHTVQMVVYENFNTTYLKIVMTRFYDKNEFYQGDTVYIRGFTMVPPTGATVSPGLYDKINVFINRPEGHEILEIGQPNEYGFYKNFSIQAPGAYDNTLGKFVQDAAALTAVTEYNTTCGLLGDGHANGTILNASLQPILSMTIRSLVGDAASVLQSQTVL